MDNGINGKKEDSMAPNIDEIKLPEVSDNFNEDDEDVNFQVLHSDIDNINSALDQMEERADSIIQAILNLVQENKELVKEIQEEKQAMDGVEENLKNTGLDDNKKP